MLIILANDRFDVNTFIKNIDVKTVKSLKNEDNFERKYLTLTIPQFKINFDKSLIQILRTLGIKNAFNKQTANFSGISSDQPNRRLLRQSKKFLLRQKL